MNTDRGYLILAQPSECDYVRMAYALALSIKVSQKKVKSVAIAVLSEDDVPVEYRHAFDHIVIIPWMDAAANSTWKIENKWKYIHMSPFEHTVVLDADMIITTNIDSWWPTLEKHDIYFTTETVTFRGEVITSDHCRKVFTTNQLPNVHTALFYFNKSEFSFSFFELLETIFNNWQRFYYECLDENRPTYISGDVCYALAVKLLGIENVTCTNKLPGFVHMKTKLQNVPDDAPDDWTLNIPSYYTSGDLYVGNYIQHLPFHYHVKTWLTDRVISDIKGRL